MPIQDDGASFRPTRWQCCHFRCRRPGHALTNRSASIATRTASGMNLHELLQQSDRPFLSHPQVAKYYPAASIEEMRRRLGRSIERGEGPGVVFGASGTGKSMLLQVLAAQYHQRFDVVLMVCANAHSAWTAPGNPFRARPRPSTARRRRVASQLARSFALGGIRVALCCCLSMKPSRCRHN